MKFISLNTYAGHFFEPLMKFIKMQAPSTDVFCFQEMLNTPTKITTSRGARANLLAELCGQLENFQGLFVPAQDHYDTAGFIEDDISFGVAMFINKKHAVKGHGDLFIHGTRNSFIPPEMSTFPHNLQYVQLHIEEHPLTIVNLHGTAEPGTKLDTPERLAQSQKILDLVAAQPGQTIITGDFNLLPHTRSIAMFEESGLHNLVRKYSIQSTRGSLVKKLHPEYGAQPDGWQEFADYTFISSGITPLSFTVPDVPVSDHLPLIFEFTM